MIETRRWFIAFALIGVAAVGAAALGGTDGSTRVHLSLVAEKAAIVPGEVNWIGLQYDIEDGWHTYWNGQNDAGSPMEVTPTLPEGFSAGDLVWPAPKRHISPGPLLDHVYEKRVVLLMPVKAPAGLTPGSNATFKVSSTWIVCKSACEVGSEDASITLPVVAKGGDAGKGAGAAAIAAARERVPVKAPADAVTTRWKDATTLEISSTKGKKLAFYPAEGSGKPVNLVKGGETENGVLTLEFEKPSRVTGVVDIAGPGGDSGPVRPMVYILDATPPGANPATGDASHPNSSR